MVVFVGLSNSGPDVAPAVDPERFTSHGAWWVRPGCWDRDSAEGALLRWEARAVIESAIAALPPGQRAVITLRDIEGLDSVDIRIDRVQRTPVRFTFPLDGFGACDGCDYVVEIG